VDVGAPEKASAAVVSQPAPTTETHASLETQVLPSAVSAGTCKKTRFVDELKKLMEGRGSRPSAVHKPELVDEILADPEKAAATQRAAVVDTEVAELNDRRR